MIGFSLPDSANSVMDNQNLVHPENPENRVQTIAETRGRAASLSAGRPDFQQDGDFHQQDGQIFSRTTIFPGRAAKSLAGRRKNQQGEQGRAFWPEATEKKPTNRFDLVT